MEKKTLTYKGTPVRLPVDFSAERAPTSRRSGANTLSAERKIIVKEVLYLAKLS